MPGFSTAPGTYVSNYTQTSSQYVAAANGAGFNAGDVLQNTQTFNPATVPPTLLSTTWSNLTQQTTGLVAPATVDIDPGSVVTTRGLAVIASEYLFQGVPSANYATGDVVQVVATYDTSVSPSALVNVVYNNITQDNYNVTPALGSGDLAPISGGSGQVVTNNYYAIATVAGQYTIGDVVQNEQKLDTSATPPTSVSSVWTNLTTGSVISTPAQADILPVDTPAAAGTITAAGTVTNMYVVIVGFAQGNPQDVLQNVISYNLGVNPPAPIGSVWNNVTQNVANITPPVITDLAAFNTPLAEINKVSSTAMFLANIPSAGNYAIDDIIQKVVIWDTYSTPQPTPFSVSYNNLSSGVDDITVNLADLTALGGVLINPRTINSRQLTTAIAAQQAPSQIYQNGVVITADGNNLQPVYIGGDNTVSVTTGYPLVPGQSISYGVENLDAIWYLGLNATDILFITGN